ncbi:MAG: transporter substrate-binding domain-containing protein, partial [Gammaproteobacteria bacterium]|nr:transporter substrate-binding domain-containing protein [Gammaproteobacteria bacterium]
MLDNDRLDVVVMSDFSGEALVREAGLIGVVKPVGAPLSTRPLFLHLHKSHANLIPKLEKTLREMEDSGEADSIRRKCRDKFYE